MNKRKSMSDVELQMFPKAKQIKLSENCSNLLDDIQFMDFDEEFISSEGTSDGSDVKKLTEDLLDGIDFDSFHENEVNRQDDLLDLTTWKRCVIDSCHRDARSHDLIVVGYEDRTKCDINQKTDTGSKKMECRLQHFWANSRIEVGDIVSIMAAWNAKLQCYCVTNMNGLVVVRPDFLVSGTTVVGGLFCMRKAVLQDRFKGIEAGIKIMTIGSIVHELFQIVLRRRLTTREQIKALSDEMLTDGGLAYTLYSSSMDASEARKEFDSFLDKIYEFMQRYVEGIMPKAANKNKTDNFTGTIESIEDIEENIWLPRLGLKGKIDVSVKVKRQKNEPSQYMPLELKTGRASFSPEHTGQLIIYQMMMTEIEKTTIDSGLLLYLREGVMREVKGTHNERRDLLLLRNEISYFLSKQYDSYATISQRSRFTEDTGNLSTDDLLTELMRISYVPELPEPINRSNVCASCPYNVLCSVYINQDTKTLSSLDSKHALREIGPLVTAHLTDAHINYFCHWVGLMALEDQENRKSNPNKVIWLETPEHRQKCGRSVIDLMLDPNVEEQRSGEYVHEFSTKVLDLISFGFDVGNYLIVSTKQRHAIATGPVISITKSTITLILDRNLCERYRDETFVLDKYESQTNATFNMSNLGALLDSTEASERLRKIVIDRTKPTFTKTLPKIITTTGKSILMSLNANQRTAILRALTANEYLLLKGLPGTGKTQTLGALIRLLVLMEKSVLITSHTHSAVDNLLLRLQKYDDQIQFMRLGSSKRIHPDLRMRSEDFYTSNCKTPDELTSIYNKFNVVGVTCLGSGHPLLTQRVFDVCLVDESTQVFQSTVLRPLFSAKKIILVGDPDQLPPIIRSSMAKKLGADESLFARLDSNEATVALTHQYRMNKTIMKLANDLTYHGALKCANDEVANATFKVKVSTKLKWIQRTLSPHIDQSVIFLNTGNVADLNNEVIDKILGHANPNAILSPTKMKSTRIYTNYCEVAIILAIVKELKVMGLASKMIGIIAPYALQVDLLKKTIEKHFDPEIEVNTVDQYQGRDKEVIIYSCTRSKGTAGNSMKSAEMRKNNEILEDQRRLTVAITRAKHKLIMVGDTVSLDCYRPFKTLITSMSKMNKINLMDQQQSFDWRILLSVFDSN